MNHRVIIVDATPLVADVVSGAVPEPRPVYQPTEAAAVKKYLRPEGDGWVREIYAVCNAERSDGTPLHFTAEDFSREGILDSEELIALLAVPSSPRGHAPFIPRVVFLAGLSRPRGDGDYDYEDTHLGILLNEEGTQAAFIEIIHPDARCSECGASVGTEIIRLDSLHDHRFCSSHCAEQHWDRTYGQGGRYPTK